MNVLELHARHKPRWNGDEWWKPDDFLWKVDWQAENLTTKIDRKGIHGRQDLTLTVISVAGS